MPSCREEWCIAFEHCVSLFCLSSLKATSTTNMRRVELVWEETSAGLPWARQFQETKCQSKFHSLSREAKAKTTLSLQNLVIKLWSQKRKLPLIKILLHYKDVDAPPVLCSPCWQANLFQLHQEGRFVKLDTHVLGSPSICSVCRQQSTDGIVVLKETLASQSQLWSFEKERFLNFAVALCL